MSDYEKIMLRCLQLARLGEYYVAPNPMVGAVLVMPNGSIIGEGWHQEFGKAHAEVNAFAAADRCIAKRGWDAEQTYRDACLFVSLEPCSHYGKTPPCADLIIRKGVKKVVVGCTDPHKKVAGQGISRLQAAGIETVVGVLEQECLELNKRFICLHEKGRPYVTLKWAQTADGFIDYKRTEGKPLVISTPISKMEVHKMRAQNMSIMVGTNTVLLDNPRLLTTRWSGRNPIRITLDRHQRIPAEANIFSLDNPTIVYRENTEWQYILKDLASRNIHSVLVEGGRLLLENILRTGIYDEIHIETNDRLTIGDGIPAPQIP